MNANLHLFIVFLFSFFLFFFCISVHTSIECISWMHTIYAIIFLTVTPTGLFHFEFILTYSVRKWSSFIFSVHLSCFSNTIY